jgi:hypothetical protein
MTHNTRRTRKNRSNSKESERRDTLHDFSIEYIKALAEVFGWRVRAAKGSKKGPDLVIESVTENGVKAVMFVESEVGHDQRGGEYYFAELAKSLQSYLEEYKKEDVKPFSLVVITNAPRRLAEYAREHRHELSEKLGFSIVEGLTLFIVPVLLVKEVMPAIFVRAMGAVGLLAPSIPKAKIESY